MKSVHPRVVAAPILVAAALGLTACVPTAGPLAIRPGTGANDDALLTGTVRISSDCVWIEAEDAAYIPVFELSEARIEGAGTLIYGLRYRDGDRIQVPGGVSKKPGSDWYVPVGCPDADLWAAAPALRPS